MKLEVVYPDPEQEIRPVLRSLLVAEGEDVPVGVSRPDGWTPDEGPCVTIAWDGTPRLQHPIAAWPTVRVTVHADTTTEAKRLAALCLGLLCASDLSVKPLAIIAPATDPDRTTVEMASFTVRLTTRSQPLPAGS